MTDNPIDPTDIEPPRKGRRKAVTGKGFGRQQTEEERTEETKRADPFTRIVALGEGWWRYEGFAPSEDDQRMVQMLKFSGYTDEDIASALYMSVETLQKHFAFELRNAKTLIIGDLATRAYTRARQGNDVMTMFLLKTRGGGAFSEKVSQAQAITESLKDVDGLSDDKKAHVIASLVDLLNPKKEKAAAKKEESE